MSLSELIMATADMEITIGKQQREIRRLRQAAQDACSTEARQEDVLLERLPGAKETNEKDQILDELLAAGIRLLPALLGPVIGKLLLCGLITSACDIEDDEDWNLFVDYLSSSHAVSSILEGLPIVSFGNKPNYNRERQYKDEQKRAEDTGFGSADNPYHDVDVTIGSSSIYGRQGQGNGSDSGSDDSEGGGSSPPSPSSASSSSRSSGSSSSNKGKKSKTANTHELEGKDDKAEKGEGNSNGA